MHGDLGRGIWGELVRTVAPRLVVEVGVHYGGTSIPVAMLMRKTQQHGAVLEHQGPEARLGVTNPMQQRAEVSLAVHGQHQGKGRAVDASLLGDLDCLYPHVSLLAPSLGPPCPAMKSRRPWRRGARNLAPRLDL